MIRIVRIPYGWRATLLVGLFWVVFLAYAYRYFQPVVVAEWAICLLFALNLVTFIYFGHDKSTARRQVYRVPVKVLMALTSAGGSPAAGLAMLIFRHKTKKRAFRIAYFLVIAIHIAMVLGAYKVRAHLPLSVEVPLPFATHLQEFSGAAVDRLPEVRYFSAPRVLENSELTRRGQAAVVRLADEVGNLLGSGFMLNQQHVVTNRHVVAGHEYVWLQQAVFADDGSATISDISAKATVVSYPNEEVPDLAIINNSLATSDSAELALPLPDILGEVKAFGFPGVSDDFRMEMYRRSRHPTPDKPDLTPDVSSGSFSKAELVAGTLYLKHYAPIGPGNSGGPLFDACGRVVGVNSFGASPYIERDKETGKVKDITPNTAYWAVSARALADYLDTIGGTIGVDYRQTDERCSTAGSNSMIVTVAVIVALVIGSVVFFVARAVRRRRTDASTVGTYSKAEMWWPVCICLAMLLGVELPAIFIQTTMAPAVNAMHSNTDSRAFVVTNLLGEEIANVQIRPYGADEWSTVAQSSIPAGDSQDVKVPSTPYRDQCRFKYRVVVGESTSLPHGIDLCAKHRHVSLSQEVPLFVETEPRNALVKVVGDEKVLFDGPMRQPSVQLPPGEYQVYVTAEGYETAMEDVLHQRPRTALDVRLCKKDSGAYDVESDCVGCPKMVVVPEHCYQMERADGGHEYVRASPFAVGKYEVTIGQWNACTNCKKFGRGWKLWEQRFRKPDEYPVNVSWNEANEYVKWLRGKTEEPYRLLREFEWEYAARAGMTTADTVPVSFECSSEDHSPVGSFSANKWGLHAMHDNVREWVENCSNDRLGEKKCIVRGAYGSDSYGVPALARSSARADTQYACVGFRVAKTLDNGP